MGKYSITRIQYSSALRNYNNEGEHNCSLHIIIKLQIGLEIVLFSKLEPF